jgi:hypothetical protein
MKMKTKKTTLNRLWCIVKHCAASAEAILGKTTLGMLLLVVSTLAIPQRASAAYTALYGSGGNDFLGFTGVSTMANLKNSGWNGLICFSLSVNPNGDIVGGGYTIASGGVYGGPANWGANVAAVKAPPSTVYRFEVAIGAWGNGSFGNIKNLVASQGTGSGSILYRNFQALKNAVPGIDAINFDDEMTYDINSATAFGRMLNTLGYKVSLAPYTQQSFWVQLKNNLGSGCDLVYLQCYDGGVNNDPAQWNNAFGNGFRVMPGQRSNDHSSNIFWQWAVNAHATGGFYWADVAWAPNSNWGVTEIINGIGIPNGYDTVCQIANLNSGLFVNAATPSPGNPATGSQINQWVAYSPNQTWALRCTAPNANFWASQWTLFFNGSSQAISTGAQAQGGLYQLYPWYNGGSQKFTLIPAAGWPGCYSLQFGDGYVMDVQYSGLGNGTPIWEYTYNGSAAQIFQFRFNPQTGY